MRILINKEVKKVCFIMSILLIGFIAAGQIFVAGITEDFKNKMVIHDAGIVGYLYQSKEDKTNLAAAVTSEKSKDNYKNGEILLQAAGYDYSTRNTLLSEIRALHFKYSILMFLLCGAAAFLILLILFFYIFRQNRIFEEANEAINHFLKGDESIRLNDSDEGSLPRLFSAVNAMATSLTAHADKEKHSKEFLKNTIEDISHQLKTPLTALQMYTDIIENENSESEVISRFALKSKNELERMETLILILLKLARLDAGDIQLERLEYSARDFLESIVSGFLTRAKAENKFITVSCNRGMILSCDKVWMHEAVSNIIKNALDHTKSGDKIEISCNETPCVKEIVIQDTGEGIPKEEIHHIFKRFYKSSHSKDKQGIGIGLALAKVIVEKHGGLISVQSKLGEGSTFRIIFPKLTNL